MHLADGDRTKIQRIANAMFARERELCEVSKMAAGVVYNGELVSRYGHDCDEHSLFRIASMSKSFTAAAMLILRDEGRVLLDAPIAQYAPEFDSLRGPTADCTRITIRHLLTMASGLTTDDPWADRHLDISAADLDAAAQSSPMFAREPGTGFQYSNLGYGLLGRIIERVSGMAPQSFITERLLAPLAMTRTVWEANHAPAGTDVIVGMRTDGGEEKTPGDGGMATMGGLWSTLSDLATWIGFFTDAYPPRNDEEGLPLRRSSRREMQSMHTYAPPSYVTGRDGARLQTATGYGMGLFLHHDDATGEQPGHSGGLPGYGSNMRWVKGTPFGLVALANVTYAPMVSVTGRALEALVTARIIGKRVWSVSNALGEAGRNLASVVCAPHAEIDASLFADNVDADQPLAKRRVEMVSLVEKYGALTFSRIEPSTFADGVLVLHASSRELMIEFSLAPNGKIQAFELPKDSI